MSEAEQAEKANDGEDSSMTKAEFFERLALEGVTIDGVFYMPKGTGRQRRYFKYDPGLIKGLDAVREDGEVVAQVVGNHDEAVIEQVDKDHVGDVVYPKVRDGFGAFGPVVTVSEDEAADSDSEPDYEPLDAEELMETIRSNFAEYGFFAENDDGEQEVVSLAHPDAKLVGYVTGSHVKALPTDELSSVDGYRQAVFQALEGTDDPEGALEHPDDVPVATADMMEQFREYGNSLDEETRERLSSQVKARWEDGEYDHLRTSEDEGDDENEG